MSRLSRILQKLVVPGVLMPFLLAISMAIIVLIAIAGRGTSDANLPTISVAQGQTDGPLQLPNVPNVCCPPGAVATVAATSDPLSSTPVGPSYSPVPASPGPRKPVPTNSMPTWTALPTGVDPSWDATPVPQGPPPTLGPDAPYHMTSAGSRMPYEPKEATERASIVVLGTVRQVGPARWTTPDGKRPANPHGQDVSTADYIFTPVLVTVEQYLKGKHASVDVLLEAYGGTVGQDSVEHVGDDLYTFKQGDRVVVFLEKKANKSQVQAVDGRPLWNIMEHYTITADGRAINTYHDDSHPSRPSISLQRLLEDIAAAQP